MFIRLPQFASAVCLALLLAPPAAPRPSSDPLLPAQLGPWQQVSWARALPAEFERLVGEQGPLFREYGSRYAEQAVYRRGQVESRLTLHAMVDRSAAYGAFTLLRAGGRPVGLGEAGAALDDGLVFYLGSFFVRIHGNRRPTDWNALVRRLEKESGVQASLPTLPSYLPRENLVPGSDRYLLGPLALRQVAPLAPGDWAGFAYGAEAEAARYRLGSDEATLLIFNYPTPQIAAERLRNFRRLFNLNGTGEPGRPLLFAKRTMTLLVGVTGVTSARAASRLLDRVQYEAEFSWSEPSQPRPALNWPRTVVKLMLGTGLFVLFAFVCGVLFGLVRLIVKRLAPGRVFDRPEDTEIIRLDIDPRF